MSRILVITAFLVAACDVGSVLTTHSTTDGGGQTDGGGGGDGNGTNCETVQAANGDGHHNAGQGCLTAGCHLEGQTGAGAPGYSYGGTAYRDAAGTQPYPGATVLVTLGGVTKKLITASNGNFYITTPLLATPTNAATATSKASACPALTPMTGALTQGGGNCNNCHRTGGTTTPIHIP